AQALGIENNAEIIDAIGEAILGDVGYTESITTYGIEQLEFKTFKELETMIEKIEVGEMPFTDEQLADLLYLADQADEIKNAIDGGIDLVMEQVEDLIEPLIEEVVEDKMKAFNDRLSVVEELVMTLEYFFFSWCLDISHDC
ncbi:unnamed protein product, partial [marine sediment metagenome]